MNDRELSAKERFNEKHKRKARETKLAKAKRKRKGAKRLRDWNVSER